MSRQKRLNRRSVEILETINTIKKTCTTIVNDGISVDISWSSSSEDISEKLMSKSFKNVKKKVISLIDANEKVNNWMKNQLDKDHGCRKTGKSCSGSAKNKRKSDRLKLNICEVKLDKNVEETSPVIPRSQVKLNFNEKSTNNIGNCDLSPIIRCKRRIEFANKSLYKIPSKTSELDENLRNGALPIEKHYCSSGESEKSVIICLKNKKRRVQVSDKILNEKRSEFIENTLKNYAIPVKKQLFSPKVFVNEIFECEFSQASINFSDSPILENIESIISSQSSNLPGKIHFESSLNEISDEIVNIASFKSSQGPSKPSQIEENVSEEKISYDASKRDKLFEPPKTRKKKYVSGSVASRLQKLLKKQKSFLSLWQHEHYLAANSNFEIPALKDEKLHLRVLNFSEQNGHLSICCERVGDPACNGRYFLILNSYFVEKLTLRLGWVIQLFKPYYLFEFVTPGGAIEKCIINVCNLSVKEL